MSSRANDRANEDNDEVYVGLDIRLLDNEWQLEELGRAEDIHEADIDKAYIDEAYNDKTHTDKEGYGKFATFSMPKRMVQYK